MLRRTSSKRGRRDYSFERQRLRLWSQGCSTRSIAAHAEGYERTIPPSPFSPTASKRGADSLSCERAGDHVSPRQIIQTDNSSVPFFASRSLRHSASLSSLSFFCLFFDWAPQRRGTFGTLSYPRTGLAFRRIDYRDPGEKTTCQA